MSRKPFYEIGLITVISLAVSLSACTAWQYEIMNCDPSASIDICSRLNTEDGINPAMACSGIWRCDSASSTCQPTVRDQDRDGDLPIECGGTDCDDLNPQLNGAQRTCDCRLLQSSSTPCSIGVGACLSSGKWTCANEVATCDAPAKTPLPAPSWSSKPVSPEYLNWDWNCDGIIEENCALPENVNASKTPCVKSHCPAPVARRVSEEMMKPSPNIDAICSDYCESNNENGLCRASANVTAPFVMNCFGAGDLPAKPESECGALIVTCQCFAFFGCHRVSGAVKGGFVYCR